MGETEAEEQNDLEKLASLGKEHSLDDTPVEISEEEMKNAIAPKATKINTEGKTMADFEFFRQRKILNKEKQETGHGLVAIPKGSGILQIEYTCPYCKHKGYDEQPVPEPKATKTGKIKKVKMSKKSIKFVCGGCGKTVYVQKLKD